MAFQFNRREKAAVWVAGIGLFLFIILKLMLFPYMDAREKWRHQIEAKKVTLLEMQALKKDFQNFKQTSALSLDENEKREDFTLYSFLNSVTEKAQISGEVDWHQMTYSITGSGSHTLEWRYFKDGAVSGGDDCGWVDKLEWTGAGQPAEMPGNTGQLYAKVNSVKVAYPGEVADITWRKWSIDLASLGVDLQAVRTLAVGIDGIDASGTLYFDDFRLEPGE